MPTTTQEIVLADFSGGINAQLAPDKLQQNEALVAENVRLDETGSIAITGGNTSQNSTAYAAAGGTNTSSIHSLFWNPLIGCVAGIGQDVFIGQAFNSLTDALQGNNPNLQKMTFGIAPGKVFFDVAQTGYWTDMSNLLTVDWAPPQVATGAGPAIAGTRTQVSDGYHTVGWVDNGVNASVAVSPGQASKFLRCTLGTNSLSAASNPVTGIQLNFSVINAIGSNPLYMSLLRNGVPVGSPKQIPSLRQQAYIMGGPNDTWNTSWSQADVNSGTFGVQFWVSGANTGTSGISDGSITLTVYETTVGGFVAGTAGTGTNLTGTYTYKVTFVAANGEESDGSPDSNAIVLSAQAGTLTGIPMGDARTTGRNVYRIGGSLSSHYLVGSMNDNTTTTFYDNTTDLSALTAGIILAGDVPGDYPNSRLSQYFGQVSNPVYHYDRLFWISSVSNQIIWSKPLNAFAYPVVNFLKVGNTVPIIKIVSIFGELIIIKDDGTVWRLTGTDESSFDLSQTPANVTTDMGFSVVTSMPDKVPFFNRYGPYVFNGYTSQKLTPKLDLWFAQQDRSGTIIHTSNGFHPPEVSVGSVLGNDEAVGNADKIYWSYAETGQTSNNAILVFDLVRGNITKRATRALSLAIDPVNGFIYGGDGFGHISLMDDFNGTDDRGNIVIMNYQTPFLTPQRGSNKAFYAVELFLYTNNNPVIVAAVYDNGIATEILPAISTPGQTLTRVVRTLESPASRKAQSISIAINAQTHFVNVGGQPSIKISHIKVYYQTYPGRARTGQ